MLQGCVWGISARNAKFRHFCTKCKIQPRLVSSDLYCLDACQRYRNQGKSANYGSDCFNSRWCKTLLILFALTRFTGFRSISERESIFRVGSILFASCHAPIYAHLSLSFFAAKWLSSHFYRSKGIARRRVNAVPPRDRRCQDSPYLCITTVSFHDSVTGNVVILRGYVLYSAAQLSRVRNIVAYTYIHHSWKQHFFTMLYMPTGKETSFIRAFVFILWQSLNPSFGAFTR